MVDSPPINTFIRSLITVLKQFCSYFLNIWTLFTTLIQKITKLIIENEAKKFIELFEKTFLEETEEIEFDSEDGAVQDLVNKIVLRIKEKLNNSTNTNAAGIGLLRLLFGFIEQFVRKDKSDGKDKSSSAAETCKH